MPTIAGISYEELDVTLGSGVAHYDFDPKSRQITATKVVEVAWSDIGNILTAFLYTAHPVYIGTYALTFDYKPLGKPTGESAWEKAIVTIGYKNLPYDPTTNKEVKFTCNAQKVTIDKGGVKAVDGSTPVDRSVPKDPELLQVNIECTITYHNQTSFKPNKADCEALICQINSGSFSPDGDTSWPQDQVIYLGYEEDIKYMNNVKTYEISHKFLYSYIDWRKCFLPQVGDYAAVIQKVTGNDLYTEGDFSIFT